MAEMQFVSCERNRLAFAMPCHAQALRSRAGPSGLSPLEGRAEPKTLDRLAKVRAPSSDHRVPTLFPSFPLSNCIALQCTARAPRAMFKGLAVLSPDLTIATMSKFPYRTVPYQVCV